MHEICPIYFHQNTSHFTDHSSIGAVWTECLDLPELGTDFKLGFDTSSAERSLAGSFQSDKWIFHWYCFPSQIQHEPDTSIVDVGNDIIISFSSSSTKTQSDRVWKHAVFRVKGSSLNQFADENGCAYLDKMRAFEHSNQIWLMMLLVNGIVIRVCIGNTDFQFKSTCFWQLNNYVNDPQKALICCEFTGPKSCLISRSDGSMLQVELTDTIIESCDEWSCQLSQESVLQPSYSMFGKLLKAVFSRSDSGIELSSARPISMACIDGMTRYFFTFSHDASLRIWDLTVGKEVFHFFLFQNTSLNNACLKVVSYEERANDTMEVIMGIAAADSVHFVKLTCINSSWKIDECSIESNLPVQPGSIFHDFSITRIEDSATRSEFDAFVLASQPEGFNTRPLILSTRLSHQDGILELRDWNESLGFTLESWSREFSFQVCPWLFTDLLFESLLYYSEDNRIRLKRFKSIDELKDLVINMVRSQSNTLFSGESKENYQHMEWIRFSEIYNQVFANNNSPIRFITLDSRYPMIVTSHGLLALKEMREIDFNARALNDELNRFQRLKFAKNLSDLGAFHEILVNIASVFRVRRLDIHDLIECFPYLEDGFENFIGKLNKHFQDFDFDSLISTLEFKVQDLVKSLDKTMGDFDHVYQHPQISLDINLSIDACSLKNELDYLSCVLCLLCKISIQNLNFQDYIIVQNRVLKIVDRIRVRFARYLIIGVASVYEISKSKEMLNFCYSKKDSINEYISLLSRLLIDNGRLHEASEILRVCPESWSYYYLRAITCLKLGNYEDAKNLFLNIDFESISNMDSDEFCRKILVEFVDSNYEPAKFYFDIATMFADRDFFESALTFTQLSLLKVADDPEDQFKDSLLSKEFSIHVNLRNYEDALACLIKLKNRDNQKDCLQEYINELCRNNEIYRIVNMQFGPLELDMVRILESKASCSDLRDDPNYYEILFAYYSLRGYHKEASKWIAWYAFKISDIDQIEPRTRLSERVKHLLTAVNSLRLEESLEQWIPSPFTEETKFMPALTLNYIEGKYKLSLAKLELIPFVSGLQDLEKELQPEEAIHLCMTAEKYDTAISLATHFNVQYSKIANRFSGDLDALRQE